MERVIRQFPSYETAERPKGFTHTHTRIV